MLQMTPGHVGERAVFSSVIGQQPVHVRDMGRAPVPRCWNATLIRMHACAHHLPPVIRGLPLDPGTTITVSVKRGDEELDIEITLGYRNLVFSELKSRNDKMSGKVSVRRTGFKRVVQHEILLGPSDMGGPLFDLEGKLIGINIAKANRVEFFAIPAEEIQKILKEKAGEIAEARGEN